MAIFDRLRNAGNKRAVQVVGPNGEQVNRVDLTGTWASAIGGRNDGNAELTKLRPNADEVFKISSTAARCIDLAVDNLSSRDLEVLSPTGEPVDHYLERIWNEAPNPSQSARLFKKAIWYRVLLHGEAIVVLDRGASRVDDAKTAHIHYGNVRVRLTKPTPQAPQGDILAYEIEVENKWYTLAPSEVLWLREPDPSNPWKSRAPIDAALESIGLARAARGWQAGQLANGANPNGIVQVLGTPNSEEEYFLIRDEIEAALTGPSSAGRIAILASPTEVKFTPTSQTAQELAYLDTLKMTDEQIANALGTPLDLIGGQRTYQNLDAAWRIYWEGTLLPYLALGGSEITRQLLAGGQVARFSTADISALQEGQDALTERVSKAVNADIVTLDEAREKLGFEPLPNGIGELTLTAYRAAFGAQAAPAAARSTVEAPEGRSTFRLATGPTALVSDIDDTLIMSDGTLNASVAKYINDYKTQAVSKIILVTGRSIEDHEKTVSELEALGIAYDELHERDFGSPAQTNEYKAYKIGKLLETYNVRIAIDNDAEARKAYRDAGVPLVLNPAGFKEAEAVQESRAVSVPEYIRENAKRGLAYLEEGFGGDGLTDQTIAEAREIAAGSISEDKVRRIGPWIARHLGDLDAPANSNQEDPGYPGNGLVAHLLWGSGPDRVTSNRVRRWAEREAAKAEKAETGLGLHTREIDTELVTRSLDNLEIQARRIVARLAEAQLRDAKKRLQRNVRDTSIPADASIVFNAAAWGERAYEYLLPVIARALEEGFAQTAKTLGANLNLDEYVTIAADARTQILVDQVNTTTATILQDRLTAAATADRLTVTEYTAALEKTFGELSGYRAETIARTEMLGSYNGASRQAAVDSGVPVGREWLATNGARTRPSHQELDGYRTSSMVDQYPNGLMFPGDPDGDPEETVNCRCVELYVTDYNTGGTSTNE